MSAPVVLHDTVLHCGRVLRARILCDVWMYTDSHLRIMRGDVIGLSRPDQLPVYYKIEDVLVSTPTGHQKFRVARL